MYFSVQDMANRLREARVYACDFHGMSTPNTVPAMDAPISDH
jgi:hypothetical protein